MGTRQQAQHALRLDPEAGNDAVPARSEEPPVFVSSRGRCTAESRDGVQRFVVEAAQQHLHAHALPARATRNGLPADRRHPDHHGFEGVVLVERPRSSGGDGQPLKHLLRLLVGSGRPRLARTRPCADVDVMTPAPTGGIATASPKRHGTRDLAVFPPGSLEGRCGDDGLENGAVPYEPLGPVSA